MSAVVISCFGRDLILGSKTFVAVVVVCDEVDHHHVAVDGRKLRNGRATESAQVVFLTVKDLDVVIRAIAFPLPCFVFSVLLKLKVVERDLYLVTRFYVYNDVTVEIVWVVFSSGVARGGDDVR